VYWLLILKSWCMAQQRLPRATHSAHGHTRLLHPNWEMISHILPWHWWMPSSITILTLISSLVNISPEKIYKCAKEIMSSITFLDTRQTSMWLKILYNLSSKIWKKSFKRSRTLHCSNNKFIVFKNMLFTFEIKLL